MELFKTTGITHSKLALSQPKLLVFSYIFIMPTLGSLFCNTPYVQGLIHRRRQLMGLIQVWHIQPCNNT
ncbi:MAG: hypothetical protein ACKPKO_24685, partial [Candidatus Fonsibacter sp.]